MKRDVYPYTNAMDGVKLSDEQLAELTEHENSHWSKIFREESAKGNSSLYSSYWWQDYYARISSFIENILGEKASIIELGSGSGKATLLLNEKYQKSLVDISEPALAYAKLLRKRIGGNRNVSFILDNVFGCKVPDKSFDLCWNIGVIEHYEESLATTFVEEMIRVTQGRGFVGVGVPNFKSFHIKKARLLNHPWLKYFPGYRLDNEIDYSECEIIGILKKAADGQQRDIKEIYIIKVGNPLPMGTPKYIIKTLGYLLNRLMSGRRFLTLVVAEME